MEKSRSEILSEIQETLASLKARIAELEERLAGLEEAAEAAPEQVEVPEPEPVAAPEPAPDEAAPIDISLDVDDVDFAPAEPEPVPEVKPEAIPEETEPEEELLMDGPARTNINDRQGRNVRKAVMDVVGQKLAWKTAMPGTPVKNVISAISLNDRVLFINTLFKEDPMAFQEAIAAFNGMSSFDEAEEYVRTNYP
ncbi:MAG: hypothetical protein IKX07_07435, partial [Bacteroidales bacterium]|nr:hypothetical protein [Bacteroidales bacterium]